MKYMGSKRFMVNEIVDIVNNAKDLFGCDKYYDLFMGGCNVIEHIDMPYRLGNDINKYLIAFIKYIRENGTDKLPEYFTRETWYDVKYNPEKYDDAVVFYVMNFRSFNGNWGQGYGGYYHDKYGNARNQIASAKRSLIKEQSLLNGFELSNKDYRDVEIAPHSIVYLDPPYNGTNGYKGAGCKFNHWEFYSYAKELAKDNFVILSEYFMPKPFICIKSIEKRACMRGDKSGSTECLFLVDGGWGVDEYLDKCY